MAENEAVRTIDDETFAVGEVDGEGAEGQTLYVSKAFSAKRFTLL